MENRLVIARGCRGGWDGQEVDVTIKGGMRGPCTDGNVLYISLLY